MIKVTTGENSPLKYSQWDEQGMYIPIPDLERIRAIVLDYIYLLTSEGQYNTKDVTQARLLLMQLGGDKS